MQHGPPNRGLTRLEVAAMVVVSGIFAFLVANALPLLNGEGSLPRRAVCSANIRDIIQGMYEYAQSDNGCFPNVPPAGGIFINGAIPCAVPSARGTYDKKTGFIPSRKNGRMAVRSLAGSPLACLWLTVTNGWVRPTAFICPADPNAISPSIEFAGRVDNSRRYYLNFGMGYDGPLRSGGGESYSFAYPWVHGGPAAWWNDGSNIPNSYQTPLVSDMAPMQDLRAAGREKRNVTEPIKNSYGQYIYNSGNHGGDGQNVGYADDHVAWTINPYVGMDHDNIFTYGKAGTHGGGTPIYPSLIAPAPELSNHHPFDIVMVPTRNVATGRW